MLWREWSRPEREGAIEVWEKCVPGWKSSLHHQDLELRELEAGAAAEGRSVLIRAN